MTQYFPSSASFRISLSSVSSDTASQTPVLPLKVLQAPHLIDLQPRHTGDATGTSSAPRCQGSDKSCRSLAQPHLGFPNMPIACSGV